MRMLAKYNILIYTERQTPRLAYIVTTLFKGEASITDNINEFNDYKQGRINYSCSPIEGVACHIYPHELLFQENIAPQLLNRVEWKSQPAFFATAGSIPFDLFAAAFYLITRYEEYLPHQTDELGRYQPEQSIAFQYGFLQTPLVNQWMLDLSEQFNFKVKWGFSFRPSYDIDMAYSYQYHSPLRNTLGYFKNLVSLKFSQVVERMQVLAGVQKDPYDVYDWLHLMHESLQLKPIYFFLVSPKRDQLHKNISPQSSAMQNLMIEHAKKYSVGIHPAVTKKNLTKSILEQMQLLHQIIKQPIQQSRQHYIDLHFPLTYEALVKSGILFDYSMGYPQINGFRASFTGPFKWFNLVTNESTLLTIFPFCYMDATAIFNEKKTLEEAAELLDHCYNLYEKYGGVFIPIFHNNFLTTQPAFIAWRNLYADFLIKHCTRLVK